MAASFKSHVLLRDEKGFMGVPFKRLLLAGVGGGLTYTLFNLALPDLALVAGVGVAVITVVMTGTRGGIPLWQRLLYRVRGALLLAASRDTQSVFGRLALALDLPLDLVQLDAAVIFAPARPDTEIDMREWVTFARAAEADRDDGLLFVDAPMAGESGR
ncbi:MAG: hypothetical protein B6D42_00105 [Anaerolineae bacterium UTCFX5]|jgi:hypothetical protein|nr:MAG: hypothetical protein B6D42_00105 [Anaerolineae bacterium UTCFX5]